MGRTQNHGFILFLFLCLFLFSAPLPASAQQVVLKMGTLAPEGTAWVKAFRDIGRELEQKTGKQVTLRIFPGGVLGDEEDMLRKIKVGQIQGALLTGGGLGLIFKDLKILAIPFLFQNYGEVDALLDKMNGFFRKGLEDNGFQSMGWAEQGFVYQPNDPFYKVSRLMLRAKYNSSFPYANDDEALFLDCNG